MFDKKLKTRREEIGLSQEGVAAFFVKTSAVRLYLNGNVGFHLDKDTTPFPR